MLTERSSELERVRGLRGGADDYLPKPFGNDELAARVGALVRRAGAMSGVGQFADARLSIDFVGRTVRFDGRPVELTALEFSLLSALVRNADTVMSRDQLLGQVWGDMSGSGGYRVRYAVALLRSKLSPDSPDEAPIATRRGFGYVYETAV